MAVEGAEREVVTVKRKSKKMKPDIFGRLRETSFGCSVGRTARVLGKIIRPTVSGLIIEVIKFQELLLPIVLIGGNLPNIMKYYAVFSGCSVIWSYQAEHDAESFLVLLSR